MSTKQELKELSTWFHNLSDEELLEAYNQELTIYANKEHQEEYNSTEIPNTKTFNEQFERIFGKPLP